MAMKENSRKVFEFLKERNGEDYTAADVATMLDLPKRSVDGIFTSAICRKGLGFRQEAERQNEDGTHDKVKYLKLTAEGLAFDPDQSDVE